MMIEQLKHKFNLILAVITCIMVLLIALLSWSLILFAIYDVSVPHTLDSMTIYKLLGAFWIIFALFSHVFCQVIMYDDKIFTFIISRIKNHSTNWLVILTLGYINTYMLDLYLIKNKYTHDFVMYNNGVTETMWIILPILNLIAYYKMIWWCRKYRDLKEGNLTLLKLYSKGQLMTYLIRNY